MAFMTDKTPTPNPAALAALRAVPSFGVWFRVHNQPASLVVIVPAQIAGAYFAMVILRGIRGAHPFPSLQDFLPLLGFLAVLELVLTYWRYRRFIKVRRAANLDYNQTADGAAAATTSGGSGSPAVPVIVPDIPSKDGDSPSAGGHSPSGGKDGGGTDSSGDSGGSDGGGGGGE